MNISIFDLFKIGIGPSSSHTVGPMRAAYAFAETLDKKKLLNQTENIIVDLYGSLALTGTGHGTDIALLMGLEGEKPDQINPSAIHMRCQKIRTENTLNLLGKHIINFNEAACVQIHPQEVLEHHSNGMRFSAFDKNNQLSFSEVYYSTGGGFIVTAKDFDMPPAVAEEIPFPFDTAAELLTHCHENNLTIPQVMLANEKIWHSENEIRERILRIAKAMEDCANAGCHSKETILPGGLNVRRRAPPLFQQLIKNSRQKTHQEIMYWLNVWALAVNEENAAFGRVVTAPTNGASGIIPSVLMYYKKFADNPNDDGVINFLLTAAAIGILYKKRASISGAEVGCQGEVGVACSMAAGALAMALGGTLMQIENAAEIGMEHNLGLTCDPVNGLVQVPCIERNAMGAVKAVTAAYLALAEDGEHKVSLDKVIATMKQTGKDMQTIYKETSLGGLAVNVPEC